MLAASSSSSSCLVGVVVGRGSRNLLELTIVVAQLFATHVKLEDHFGQLVELVPAVHRVRSLALICSRTIGLLTIVHKNVENIGKNLNTFLDIHLI